MDQPRRRDRNPITRRLNKPAYGSAEWVRQNRSRETEPDGFRTSSLSRRDSLKSLNELPPGSRFKNPIWGVLFVILALFGGHG